MHREINHPSPKKSYCVLHFFLSNFLFPSFSSQLFFFIGILFPDGTFHQNALEQSCPFLLLLKIQSSWRLFQTAFKTLFRHSHRDSRKYTPGEIFAKLTSQKLQVSRTPFTKQNVRNSQVSSTRYSSSTYRNLHDFFRLVWNTSQIL